MTHGSKFLFLAILNYTHTHTHTHTRAHTHTHTYIYIYIYIYIGKRNANRENVFDAIIGEQVLNLKNIIIMKTRSSLLEVSGDGHNHQRERGKSIIFIVCCLVVS